MMLGTSRDEGATFCGTAPNMTQTELASWAAEMYPGVTPQQIMALYGDIKASAGVLLPRAPARPMHARHPRTRASCWLSDTNVIATSLSCAGRTPWYWGSVKIAGDVAFHCGARSGARWLSGGHPVFLYSFAPVDFPGGVIGHCAETACECSHFLDLCVYPAQLHVVVCALW